MSFIDELKRRNVLRVAMAYLAGGWLLIQLVETLFPIFGLSDALVRLVVIVLIIGLPITLILSWLYELTPDGLKRESEVSRAHSITHRTGGKLDHAIIIFLTLALGYFAFDKFVLDPARDVTLEEAVAERTRDEMRIQSYGDKSIAVLPFVNMSDDASNEYFSDGISEEVLNLLASFSQLRVISRSSAFSFKGQDTAIPTIAEALNVGHILEGSVRKAGNTVRITAQLIEARTDTHLWSETYDRELDDVFAIQDEIAATVVEKLRVTLLGDAPKTQPTDPRAYELYLQARHLRRQQTTDSLIEAERLYKESLKIEPDYIPSWIGLSAVYDNQIISAMLPPDEGYELAQQAIERALAIDPNSAAALEGLGWLADKQDNDLSKAAVYVQRALELEPHDPLVLASTARLLMSLGRLDEATVIMQYVITRDPLNPIHHNNLGAMHIYNHRFSEAKIHMLKILEISPDYIGARYFVGLTDLLMGDAEAAREAFDQESDDIFRLKGQALANFSLGNDNAAELALAELINNWGEEWPAEVAHVYTFRGDLNNAFKWLEYDLDNFGGWGEARLDPLLEKLHGDPRWQAFLEKLGVSDRQLAEISFELTLPTN
jgi:adenylate cyclase